MIEFVWLYQLLLQICFSSANNIGLKRKSLWCYGLIFFTSENGYTVLDHCVYKSISCFKWVLLNQVDLFRYRINRIKIIEHLYDVWAADRKAEWSIWTVHSKIDMPTHYLRSGADDSSHRNSLGKVVVSRKFSDDVLTFLSPNLNIPYLWFYY